MGDAGKMHDDELGTDRSAKRSSSMFSGSVMMMIRGAPRVDGGAAVAELGESRAGSAALCRRGRETSTGKEENGGQQRRWADMQFYNTYSSSIKTYCCNI